MCSYSPSRELLFPLLSSFVEFSTSTHHRRRCSGRVEKVEKLLLHEKKRRRRREKQQRWPKTQNTSPCDYTCVRRSWTKKRSKNRFSVICPQLLGGECENLRKKKRRWNVRKEKWNENKNKREEETWNEGKKKISHDHKVNFEICSYAAPCQWLWVSRIMLFPTLSRFVSNGGISKNILSRYGRSCRASLSSAASFGRDFARAAELRFPFSTSSWDAHCCA